MTALTAPRVTGTVKLADGRRLGYAAFGVPNGDAVIWLHGTPGARTQVPQGVRDLAHEMGLRIICIDRPGVGASSDHVYGSIADFATDLEQVLDALGIARTALVGLSGGGPYVLAGGALLADRVSVVASLGGVAPTVGPDAIGGGLASLAPRAAPFLRYARTPLGLTLRGVLNVSAPLGGPILDLYARYSPPGDREVLSRPEFKEMFIRDLVRGGRRQFVAPFTDALLFGKHWGFELADVKTPVHWWHGEADNIVPFAHGEHMVEKLPDATFHPMVGGGHLAGFGATSEVIGTLAPLIAAAR